MTNACVAPNEYRYYRTDRSLIIDPNNTQSLFVGVEYKGMYHSIDGGITWQQIMKDISWKYSCFPEPFKALISPSNSNTIFFSSNGDGILKTSDGGITWNKLYTSQMYPRSEEFSLDPTNDHIIYAAAENTRNASNPNDNSNVTKGLVYKSIDSGNTWTELTTPLVNNAGNNGIIISKTDTKHILAFTILVHYNQGSRQADTSGQLGILESKDSGQTWNSLHTLPTGYDAITYAFSSLLNPKNIYVTPFTVPGTPLKGFFSMDFGQTWSESSSMSFVAYDPYDSTGNHALGFTNQVSPGTIAQLYETNNAGKTWHPFVKLPNEIVNVADNKTLLSNIMWDPKNSKILYLSGASSYVWKSVDSGKTWNTILSLDKISTN